ncbi:MAG: hypothetical protein ABIF17_04315 [Patescibacteria group bacterium]
MRKHLNENTNPFEISIGNPRITETARSRTPGDSFREKGKAINPQKIVFNLIEQEMPQGNTEEQKQRIYNKVIEKLENQSIKKLENNATQETIAEYKRVAELTVKVVVSNDKNAEQELAKIAA